MRLFLFLTIVFFTLVLIISCEKNATDFDNNSNGYQTKLFYIKQYDSRYPDTIAVMNIDDHQSSTYFSNGNNFSYLEVSKESQFIVILLENDLTILNTETKELETVCTRSSFFDLSYDGRFLIFTGGNYSEYKGLFLYDFQNKSYKQLSVYMPVYLKFASDNQHICFSTFTDLYVMNINDSTLKSILHFDPSGDNKNWEIVDLSYNNDGSKIAFVKYDDQYPFGYEAYISFINSDGSDLLVTEISGENPLFSPTSDEIVYESRSSAVYSLNSDGSGNDKLFEGNQIWRYKFTPDGMGIVFSAPGLGSRCDLYLFDIATRSITNLTNSYAHETFFDIIKMNN